MDPGGRQEEEHVHPTVRCDECHMFPLRGIWYKCQLCPDYDLCTGCKQKGEHSEHELAERRPPYPTVLTDAELIKLVKDFYSTIVDSFDPKDTVLNVLISKRIITFSEKTKICEMQDKERGGGLLDLLLDKPRPGSIRIFLEALFNHDVYYWIPKKIYEASKKAAFNSAANSSVSLQSSSTDPKQMLGACSSISQHVNKETTTFNINTHSSNQDNESSNNSSGTTVRTVCKRSSESCSLSCHFNIETKNVILMKTDENYLEHCTTTDIEKCVGVIEQSQVELSNCLDPENGLLFLLKTKKVINDDVCKEIEDFSTYQEMNERLLRHLLPKLKSSCRQFLEVLIQNEQEHVAYFIVHQARKINWKDRLLTEKERKFIDGNMFCLVNLIKPYRSDFLNLLVEKRCITGRHRQKVERCYEKQKNVYELLVILQRRSYVDFNNFKRGLNMTMQNKITKILEEGGVAEISVQLQEIADLETIESKLVDILSGYSDKNEECELSPEQEAFLEKLLLELEEKGIHFIGNRLSQSMALYFQFDTDAALQVLKTACRDGTLLTILENLYQFLFKVLNLQGSLNLVKTVVLKKFSCKHDGNEGTIFHRKSATMPEKCSEICTCFSTMANDDAVEMILQRASWLQWLNLLVESHKPGSSISIECYLMKKYDGFVKFVRRIVSNIYEFLTTVCKHWKLLIKQRTKSFIRKLLHQVTRTVIHKSYSILVAGIHIQVDCLIKEQVLSEKDVKEYDLSSENNPTRKENFVNFLKMTSWKQFCDFLVFLNKNCQSHLVNHMISFGVPRPIFEKTWPLNDTLNAIITANRDILIQKIDPKKPVQAEEMKMQDQNLQQSEDVLLDVNSTKRLNAIQLNINQSSEDTHDLDYKDTREIDMKNSKTASDLFSFLTNRGVITVEMRDHLNKKSTIDGHKKLLDLIEHGSTQMYETIVEYLERTGQSDVVQFLQPNYELQRNSDSIRNCMCKAKEVAECLYLNKQISSDQLKQIKEQQCRSQRNDLIVKLLQRSRPETYLHFLNALLATKQLGIIPLFQDFSLSKLLMNSRTFLVESIDANSRILHKLTELCIITNTQKEEIQSMKSTSDKNTKLLSIISQKPFKCFYLFLSALVEDNQSHVLDKLSLSSVTHSAIEEDSNFEDEGNSEFEDENSKSGISSIQTTNVEKNDYKSASEDISEFRNEVFQEKSSVNTVQLIKIHQRFDKYIIDDSKKNSLSPLYEKLKRYSTDRFPERIQNLLSLKVALYQPGKSLSFQNLSTELSCLLKDLTDKDWVGFPVFSSKQDISFIIQADPAADDKQISDHFTLIKPLGGGSSGIAYLVKHKQFGEIVFKKIEVTDDIEMNRFQHESEIYRHLHHPNIVHFYGVYSVKTTCGHFLEYMKYGDVGDFIKEFEVTWQWKTQIVHDVAQAMVYLHNQQPCIIHGDLKPEHILINGQFRAKVSDFELASSQITTQSPHFKYGTLPYIAPEYLEDRSKQKTVKYDVYGFAISVWEIYSGKRHYDDFQVRSLIEQFVINGSRPAMADIPTMHLIPYSILHLMKQCWNKSEECRPSFNDITSILSNELSQIGKVLQVPVKIIYQDAFSFGLPERLDFHKAQQSGKLQKSGNQEREEESFEAEKTYIHDVIRRYNDTFNKPVVSFCSVDQMIVHVRIAVDGGNEKSSTEHEEALSEKLAGYRVEVYEPTTHGPGQQVTFGNYRIAVLSCYIEAGEQKYALLAGNDKQVGDTISGYSIRGGHSVNIGKIIKVIHEGDRETRFCEVAVAQLTTTNDTLSNHILDDQNKCFHLDVAAGEVGYDQVQQVQLFINGNVRRQRVKLGQFHGFNETAQLNECVKVSTIDNTPIHMNGQSGVLLTSIDDEPDQPNVVKGLVMLTGTLYSNGYTSSIGQSLSYILERIRSDDKFKNARLIGITKCRAECEATEKN